MDGTCLFGGSKVDMGDVRDDRLCYTHRVVLPLTVDYQKFWGRAAVVDYK